MQRRTLLKNAAFTLGGLVAYPTWAEGWNAKNWKTNFNFSVEEDALLAEIVDTILPENATPGAKSLGVHQLIQKLVTDCQGPQAEAKMKANLKLFNTFTHQTEGNDFIQLSPEKRLAIMKKMMESDQAEIKSFANQLKRMTIDGYLKSEYAMTNITGYEYAPARWNACVKVKG